MTVRMTKKRKKLIEREEKGIVIQPTEQEINAEELKQEREDLKQAKIDAKQVKKKKDIKVPEPSKDDRGAREKALEQIRELELRISKTKYNKKTQHAIGLYKAQLAKLKEKLSAKSSKGKKGEGYTVSKTGDASVILIGFPSVGKSTLLNAITNANSEIGAYEFTTLDVVPGLMEYKDSKIQVLDVPGIVEGAAVGTGRGKEVLSVMQNADLIIFLVDILRPDTYRIIQKEVYETHVRVNQEKPDVKIKKTEKGGIDFGATVKLTHLNKATIEGILKTFKIMNAQVVIRTDVTADQFIDVLEGNKRYIPSITVLNKIDMADAKTLAKLRKELKPDIEISADKKINLEKLKEGVFRKLNFIRIFTKEINKKPDMKEPLIMKTNSTIRHFCKKLHKDFVSKFKFAKVWGPSAKFGGQILHLQHKLKDKDVIEIHLK